MHGGVPNLVFGVVSDTHLRTTRKGNGIGATWERIWGEKYEPVWHKEVKGYHFFGRHWGVDEEEFAKMLEEEKERCRLAEGVSP